MYWFIIITWDHYKDKPITSRVHWILSLIWVYSFPENEPSCILICVLCTHHTLLEALYMHKVYIYIHAHTYMFINMNTHTYFYAYIYKTGWNPSHIKMFIRQFLSVQDWELLNWDTALVVFRDWVGASKYLCICIFLYREFIKILLILQVMKWT